MSILILSPENMRILKRILMIDYELKSSHASELIAAMCGFKTYAALKSQLNTKSYFPSAQVDFDKFERRHKEFGYNLTSGEWMKFSFRNLHLPNRPWAIYNRSNIHKREDWFYDCKAMSIPFITISKTTKYCLLEWDCITIETKFDKHTRYEKGDELIRQMYKVYQIVCNGKETKSYFDGAAFCGTITKGADL